MKEIKECTCDGCGAKLLTIPGQKCQCGGSLVAGQGNGMLRKALGREDTDLRKA